VKNGRIIAASRAMRRILEVVRRCAPTEVPVLIHGESDTGKELIAREIHDQSRHSGGPFVRVACGTLRESEVSEVLCRRFWDTARSGTLFLENVSDLTLWAQNKLLNILQQEGEYLLGENHTGAGTDVRVIASTETDPIAAVSRGTFLSRLYYYFCVLQIHIPPLRHRPDDICPLAEKYLAIANNLRASQGANFPCRFTEDALQCLQEYDWPGNTLQLAQVVAHVVLLTNKEEIGQSEVEETLGDGVFQNNCDSISIPLVGGFKQMERAVIEAMIKRCHGNKAAAARALGLHRRTLYRLLQNEDPQQKTATPLPLAINLNVNDSMASIRS